MITALEPLHAKMEKVISQPTIMLVILILEGPHDYQRNHLYSTVREGLDRGKGMLPTLPDIPRLRRA